MARARGYTPEIIREFTERGFWGSVTLAQIVAGQARDQPTGRAFVADDAVLSWHDYDQRSSELAMTFLGGGLEPGSHVAVLLADLATTHIVYLALAKAGCTVVGIGPRSGHHEITHLLDVSDSTALVAPMRWRDDDTAELFSRLGSDTASLDRLFRVEPGSSPVVRDESGTVLSATARELPDLDPNEVFLLNSTSGTTGRPKCVEHSQNRWLHFARLAIDAAEIGADDVMMSALPTPFGFGLWTTHFAPAVAGIPTVLMAQWDPDRAIGLLEEHEVTVFAGVTTQLMMLLEVLEQTRPALPRLRAVFTGGEPVPFERARRFEELAGCAVLQFYGSNESGALSRTSLRDTQDQRLRTAGRLIAEMEVQLVAPGSDHPPEAGQHGQPTCRGPLMSSGYYGDPAANDELFGPDGRLRMPDLATIGEGGSLTVVGRVADLIIRGGMNVSATEVEQALSRHRAVDLVAVVGAPDPTFGERICAFVLPRAGSEPTLEELQHHMQELGMARYTWPERLELVDEMPISAGEKIAKAELKARVAGFPDRGQA